MLRQFSYKRAESLTDAIGTLRQPGARVLAGGTDLLGCVRDGVFDTRTVVSINGLAQLRGIRRTPNGGLRIGALTTLAEVAENDTIRRDYAVLAEAAASAASPQLRNQGTIGGNICQRPRCWYFRGNFHCLRKGGDMCYAVNGENQYHCIFGGSGCFIVHPSDTAPALVALEAQVRIAGAHGSRTIPIESFFVLPEKNLKQENVLANDEIVTEILLPRPVADLRSTYRKVRERGAWDFALVGVAAAAHPRTGPVSIARIVLSGVAPIPWRSFPAEKALEGRRLDADSARDAAAAAVQGAQPLEENRYKVALVRGVIEEALLALA